MNLAAESMSDLGAEVERRLEACEVMVIVNQQERGRRDFSSSEELETVFQVKGIFTTWTVAGLMLLRAAKERRGETAMRAMADILELCKF